jgi:hypothetical protein
LTLTLTGRAATGRHAEGRAATTQRTVLSAWNPGERLSHVPGRSRDSLQKNLSVGFDSSMRCERRLRIGSNPVAQVAALFSLRGKHPAVKVGPRRPWISCICPCGGVRSPRHPVTVENASSNLVLGAVRCNARVEGWIDLLPRRQSAHCQALDILAPCSIHIAASMPDSQSGRRGSIPLWSTQYHGQVALLERGDQVFTLGTARVRFPSWSRRLV